MVSSLRHWPSGRFEFDVGVGDSRLLGDVEVAGEPVAGEFDVPGVRVVDGNAELEEVASSAALLEDVGEEEGMADAPLGGFLGGVAVDAALDDAVRGRVEADLLVAVVDGEAFGDGVAASFELGGPCAVDAVEPFEVDGVDAILHALEPVAGEFGDERLAEDALLLGEDVVVGQQRRGLRPHVREEESAEFPHGVGRDAHLLLEPPIGVNGLLERLLDALAGLVHHPAVVHAAEPVLLGNAVGEVDAAVRAEAVDEPERAGLVAVEHEVFTEDAEGFGGALVEFGGDGDGVPVASHQFAHGGPGADLGEALVLFDGEHWGFLLGAVPAVAVDESSDVGDLSDVLDEVAGDAGDGDLDGLVGVGGGCGAGVVEVGVGEVVEETP